MPNQKGLNNNFRHIEKYSNHKNGYNKTSRIQILDRNIKTNLNIFGTQLNL